MKLNRECKRELVASVIYNLFVVVTLLVLKYFNVFDLIGINPEIESAIWLFAGIYIVASFISTVWSFRMIFRRK